MDMVDASFSSPLNIPSTLLPEDGRFGSGPSRIFRDHVAAIPLAEDGGVPLMGSSHRQRPIKDIVARIRRGLRDLYALPEGWEVVLGNGGATAFWAAATASLVRQRAAHATFGEFGAKFAQETQAAPFLSSSFVHSAPAGQVATLLDEDALTSLAEDVAAGGVRPDVCAYPHHETSTGALSPVYRVSDSVASVSEDCLTVVDATSIAGAVDIDVTTVDVYYFSPQKAFASDGGLWVALMSPAAISRAQEICSKAESGRWVPSFLDLAQAVKNSVANQTLNTPAIATLIMLDQQIQWMLAHGGLAGAQARSQAASDALYSWASRTKYATAFVPEQWRSHVVVTIDCDSSVDTASLSRTLRSHGIVDIDPYRSLGRNQLRVACFPTTELRDVEALIACIEWVVEHS